MSPDCNSIDRNFGEFCYASNRLVSTYWEDGSKRLLFDLKCVEKMRGSQLNETQNEIATAFSQL